MPSYDKANLIANWNNFSGSYYALTESYGIADPYHLVSEIPGSDTIRLVATMESGVPDYLIEFINEHSDSKDVHVVLEDTFTTVWMGEWGVYAIK